MPKDSPRNTVWIIPGELDQQIRASLGPNWLAKAAYYNASPMKSSCGADAKFYEVIARRRKPPVKSVRRRSG